MKTRFFKNDSFEILAFDNIILWSYLAGSGIVFILSICNIFLFDMLNMKDNLVAEE